MKKLVFIFPLLLVFYACSENPLNEPEVSESNLIVSQLGGEQIQINDGNMSPVMLMFEKSLLSEGVWTGGVSGDITGDLKTELLDLRVAGPVWHEVFNWLIEADEKSFTAQLSGTLNNNTGKVVMNGTVIDGWLKGAQVHEQGQLTDPDNLGFEGIIQINPATAD